MRLTFLSIIGIGMCLVQVSTEYFGPKYYNTAVEHMFSSCINHLKYKSQSFHVCYNAFLIMKQRSPTIFHSIKNDKILKPFVFEYSHIACNYLHQLNNTKLTTEYSKFLFLQNIRLIKELKLSNSYIYENELLRLRDIPATKVDEKFIKSCTENVVMQFSKTMNINKTLKDQKISKMYESTPKILHSIIFVEYSILTKGSDTLNYARYDRLYDQKHERKSFENLVFSLSINIIDFTIARTHYFITSNKENVYEQNISNLSNTLLEIVSYLENLSKYLSVFLQNMVNSLKVLETIPIRSEREKYLIKDLLKSMLYYKQLFHFSMECVLETLSEKNDDFIQLTNETYPQLFAWNTSQKLMQYCQTAIENTIIIEKIMDNIVLMY